MVKKVWLQDINLVQYEKIQPLNPLYQKFKRKVTSYQQLLRKHLVEFSSTPNKTPKEEQKETRNNKDYL